MLVHDPESGETALIDAPEEAPILAAIKRTGWTPTMILTTHHHADHVEANLALKERFELRIVGPEAEKAKIPGIDETVGQGSVRAIRRRAHRGDLHARPHRRPCLLSSSRHRKWLFTADTLFALGCGRLFECPPPVMFESLKKLAALPAETTIYCGHEYTLSNARFALTVDPTTRR